jgi:hypothetical protein
LRARDYDSDSDPQSHFDDIRENLERIDALLSLDHYEKKILWRAISTMDFETSELKIRYLGAPDDDRDKYYDRYDDDDDAYPLQRSNAAAVPAQANIERDVFEDVEDD